MFFSMSKPNHDANQVGFSSSQGLLWMAGGDLTLILGFWDNFGTHPKLCSLFLWNSHRDRIEIAYVQKLRFFAFKTFFYASGLWLYSGHSPPKCAAFQDHCMQRVHIFLQDPDDQAFCSLERSCEFTAFCKHTERFE
jgi:hypothetical protein